MTRPVFGDCAFSSGGKGLGSCGLEGMDGWMYRLFEVREREAGNTHSAKRRFLDESVN